jgi:hypothetical protein
MNDDHLHSNCYKGICSDLNCKEAVKQNLVTGNWFITMGHAGFNTATNNRNGYVSEKRARSAHMNYTK